MGKTLDWVREEPKTGRLLFRRAYPERLRPFLPEPRTGHRELKVPLAARRAMTAAAFHLYEQAKRQFAADVQVATAAQRLHDKEAVGTFDALTPERLKYLADTFARDWHLHDETALRARGGDWADRTLAGWNDKLDDFRSWRVEGDIAALEAWWGPSADRLLEAEGLRISPVDAEARERLIWALNATAIALSEPAKARLRGDVVPVPPPPVRPDPKGAGASKRRTVSDLLEGYGAAKWDGWSRSSRSAVEPVFRLLRDTIGDREVRAIDREAARDILETVKALPARMGRRKELAGLTVPQAIEVAERLGLERLEPGTINRGYMVHVSAIFGWAVTEEWADRNPFKGLGVADPVEARDKRDAFTLPQLAKLFTAAPWDAPGPHDMAKPGRYWVPLIALFTGMRLGEAAGLRIMDVEEIEGVQALRVRPHGGRTLKNKESRRDLPIHPELERLGLLSFVAHRRSTTPAEALLFPDGKANIRRQSGAKLGEWFVSLLRERGLTGTKLGMHSFRHSFEDRLRSAGLHARAEGQALAGRKVQGSEGDYGHGFTVPALRDALDRVTYPGLDLSHLEPKP